MGAEKTFENKVKRFLNLQKIWFIKYWGGGSFTKAGVPDLICNVNGYFVAVELKAPNGHVSELQRYNINCINESGGIAFALKPNQYDFFKKIIQHLIDDEYQKVLKLRDVINSENQI